MSDIAGRLERLLAGLTHQYWVHASSGAFASPGADMPEFVAEIAALVDRVVDEDAGRLFAPYTPDWPSDVWVHPKTIEHSIFPLETPADAVELMSEVASVNLVWPVTVMDRDVARETAAEVVAALGTEATWWTNRESGWVNGLTPVTFDLLVAGTNGTHFALLLQVGDD